MAIFQRTLTAAIAATALAGSLALPAWAQAEPQLPSTQVTAHSHHHAHHAGKHTGQPHAKPDFAKHQADRNERLKTILQIQPNQQTAWDSYVKATAHEPRTQQPKRPDFRKLTTPERLDLVKKLRTERTAKAEQREQATRSFYSSLNTSQQKAFDQLSQRHSGPHKAGHGSKRVGPQHRHDHSPSGHQAASVEPVA